MTQPHNLKAAKSGAVDRRSIRRRSVYDSPEFKARWFSGERLEKIALDLGVSPNAARKAAVKVRGWPDKSEAKRMASAEGYSDVRYSCD